MRDLIEVWFYTGNIAKDGSKRAVAARSNYDLVAFRKKGWIEVEDEKPEVEKLKAEKPIKVVKPKKETKKIKGDSNGK